MILLCTTMSCVTKYESNPLLDQLFARAIKIGIENPDQLQELMVLAPNRSCAPCNHQSIHYFKKVHSKKNIGLIIVSSSKKDLSFLFSKQVLSSGKVFLDQDYTLNNLEDAALPLLIRKEQDSYQIYQLKPDNIDAVLSE